MSNTDTESKIKTIVKAVIAKHPALIQQVFRDRDWLWLAGDYKDFPVIRETLKGLGFRFTAKGHAIAEQGVTANWYHSGAAAKSKRKANKRQRTRPAQAEDPADQPEVVTTVTATPAVAKDLYAADPAAEFEAMFANS